MIMKQKGNKIGWFTKKRIYYFPILIQPKKIECIEEIWYYQHKEYNTNDLLIYLEEECPFKLDHFLNGRKIKNIVIQRLRSVKFKEWEIQEWYHNYPDFSVSRNPWIYKIVI